MKKLLSIFLTALMLLGCLTAFAGCGDNADDVAGAALEEAVDYLENLYKNDAEKTPRDYDVAGKLKIGDLEYTVTWTVDVDEVTIKESATAGFYTVDVPDETAEEIPYVLTATIKDADGNTKEVSFSRKVPVLEKVVVEEDKKIVLSLVDVVEGEEVVKYVTGTHYLYTSSSGNQKWELNLTTNKAEALAMTIKTNDDNTVSFVAEGKYLFCDANDVKFVDEQGDYTKYVIETATGGSFIKCANAVYGTGESAKPQYLEMYSGYLTCYSMTNEEAKLNLFTFTMPDADDAAGKISVPTNTDDGEDEGGDDEGGNTTTVFVLNAVKPVAGTAYKFAFVQGKVNKAFYLTGVLDGYYMASSETFADGVDYFVEEVTGGYNLYCMVGGAKKYVNAVVSGNYVNGKYEDAATTVYTYDEELKTLTTIVNEEKYVFGTKKDGTFTTLGPMKASTEPFYGVFVTEAAVEEEVDAPETPEATESTIAEVLAAADGTSVIVKGVVSEINGAWSEQYKNMNVTITDGTDTLYCYRLATNVAVGDIVVVTGTVGSYNDAKQIAQGATATVTKPVALDAAVALADDAAVVVMGTVSEINGAWSEQYKNMNVTITDGTNTLYCYRLATMVEVGDIIVVTGKIGSYNNAKQIAQGATAVIIGKAEPEAPAAPGTKYEFTSITTGVQYANETHVLDSNVTLKTLNGGCYVKDQIRLYDSTYEGTVTDGQAVFECAKAVKSLSINVGNKAATLNVYGSTDGTTWTLIQAVETTKEYADHTIAIPAGTAYTQLKFDAVGAQIRIASATIEFVA